MRLVLLILGPLYSRLIRIVAYGPWGPFHQVLIWVFRTIYGIRPAKGYAKLGTFFLRDLSYELSPVPLVSPVQARVLEGPSPLNLKESLSVKGLTYAWADFKELDFSSLRGATYWNLYLSPPDYHWVHAPSEGVNLEAYRMSGSHFPVNAWGRKICPRLYVENERLVFRYQSAEWGWVILICVGAMGVSALRSVVGDVAYDRWTSLKPHVQKGERLLGFELGSTVLLITERGPSSQKSLGVVRVGDAFC